MLPDVSVLGLHCLIRGIAHERVQPGIATDISVEKADK